MEMVFTAVNKLIESNVYIIVYLLQILSLLGCVCLKNHKRAYLYTPFISLCFYIPVFYIIRKYWLDINIFIWVLGIITCILVWYRIIKYCHNK